MNFDERYHSNRIKYFVKNCSQLIEDARRYQSGEKTCHGNRPKEVRDLMLKVENYLKADPFESKTVKQIILDLANFSLFALFFSFSSGFKFCVIIEIS